MTFTIVSNLRWVIRRVMVNEYQVIIALAKSILLLQIGVSLLDLLFEILFQLVDVFDTFFVPYFGHLTQLLYGGRIFEIYLVNLFHNFFGTTFAERTFFLVCLLIDILFRVIYLLIGINF